jgi:carbonic anhydrase/acetyltransferase-like protein (isoleucine patch superfamily)
MPDLVEELLALSRNEMAVPPQRTDHRALTSGEVALLEGAGCRSADWSRVRVTDGTALGLFGRVEFRGDVDIHMPPGEFDSPAGRRGAGVRRAVLEDAGITGSVCIDGISLLRGYRVHGGAVIEDCLRITFGRGTSCGSGAFVSAGPETGERGFGSFPCLTVELASVLSDGNLRADVLHAFEKGLGDFRGSLAERERGDICGGACIRCTHVVEDSWIGAGARIENCTAVRNSTLLEGASVTDGALVRDSILQWGSSADSMAVVEESVVCECASVESSAKLRGSVLGPDSALSGGEMTACLAGPMTAMHHQSLLIAVRWPGGRGNVGYGANVGSNHTSRAPDQELCCGEGVFFGLGCSVKYPADLSKAPYSILATGVTTLPQKVAFPFSLICEPADRPGPVPEAFNQLIPAWVLSDNLYAVVRNARKCAARRRSSRTAFDPRVLRPETVSLMLSARRALGEAGGMQVYTGEDIPGVGKNFVTEEHREGAVETYSVFIRFSVLRDLLERLEREFTRDGLPPGGGDAAWVQSRGIIISEFPGITVTELLGMLPCMAEEQLESLRACRDRDRLRGARILDDPVILDASRDSGELLSRTRSMMERLGSS